MSTVGRSILPPILPILLATACGEYAAVTVVNRSGGTVTEVVVTLEEGRRYTVGRLDDGERTTISVEPEGESHLTLSYVDRAGEEREATGGYLEQAGGYRVTLRLRAGGQVDFDTELGY
jgi:hypothetical protein